MVRLRACLFTIAIFSFFVGLAGLVKIFANSQLRFSKTNNYCHHNDGLPIARLVPCTDDGSVIALSPDGL